MGLATDFVTDLTDGLVAGDEVGLATDFVTDLTDGLVAGDEVGLAADVEADVADELTASGEAVTTEQSPSPTNNPSATSVTKSAANQSPSPTNNPSATSASKSAANYTTLLSVENPKSLSDFADKPLPPLPAAELESEYICRLLSNHKRLAREEVRQQQVEAELSKKCDVFHFSGHAQYNSKQPRKSALYLTAKERLRVEDIVKLNLEAYRLVCLSACETAVTGSETISAEYVGLVSAFLSRGVGRVVSTLWTVRSDATALIIIQFYRLLLLENIPPIDALNLATRWLRDLTYGDLVEWYETLIEELPKNEAVIVPFLDNRLFEVRRKEATERVYDNPYFWAAFVISGS
jgi:CHAT domain-containing protein